MGGPLSLVMTMAGAASNRTDFSAVGYDEALARARDMIPLLREQAPAGERAGRLTPEVMAALHRSGLLRFQQPRLWGGMELDLVAYFDIPEMIARGDISVAWVLANLALHHRNLVWWPQRAQEEVWGANPDVGIAAGIAFPQGSGRRVEGGIELTGEWNFASGIDHSEWSMLACVVREDDRPVDWLYCLVPRADYEVVEDWQVLGMRATGSKTLRCRDVFVPEHRALSMYVARPGYVWPGLAIHRNPQYRISNSAIGVYCLAGCMAGNARNALETAISLVKARSTSYTGARMRDFPAIQQRIAAAGARIDAATALLRADLVAAHALYEAGGSFDTEAKLRYKRNGALGARLCVEAVDLLHEMAGANGIYDAMPLQRIFRDAHAAAGHFSFSTDAQYPPWGLVALGGEYSSPTL